MEESEEDCSSDDDAAETEMTTDRPHQHLQVIPDFEQMKTQTPVRIELVSALNAQPLGKKISGDAKGKKRKKPEDVEEELETAVKNVKLQSGGMVIDRQVSIEPMTDTEMTIHQAFLTHSYRAKHPRTSPSLDTSVISTSPQVIDIPKVVYAEDTSQRQTLRPITDLPGQIFQNVSSGVYPQTMSPLASQPASTATVSHVSMSPLNMPIKVSPSVVQSMGARKHLEKAYSTNDVPLEGGPHHRVNISRSASLHAGGNPVHLLVDRPDKKPLSPERLMERITNLISANQAIVSTPMAMPPRKRNIRQQSSAVSLTTQSPILMSSVLSRSASLSDKLACIQSASMNMEPAYPTLSRSLSMQPTFSPAMTPTQQRLDPLFVVQADAKSDHAAVKPIMQLPHTILQPTVGTNAPKEIKIQFKVPTSGISTPTKLRLEHSQSDSGVTLEVPQQVHMPDVSVMKSAAPGDVPALLIGKSQLAAMLQGYSHEQSVLAQQAPTPAQSMPQIQPALQIQTVQQVTSQPETMSSEPTYICGGCWQSFCNIDLLKEHQLVSCASTVGAKPATTVNKMQTITLEQAMGQSATLTQIETSQTEVRGSKPPKLTLQPSTETIFEPNLGPITMVTPPTPTPPTPTERKRGVLQRQKNVVLEMVDPRVPPKRGRPKGARSVDTSFFGGTGLLTPDAEVNKRPLLQRSQSTIEPSSNVEEIPGELRGETPQALWKLKLKGRLLMKRSMSVERMLSQEKEQENLVERQGKATLSPISATKQSPLLRSKSYDETITSAPKPAKDVLNERILSKLSSNLSRAASIDIEEEYTPPEDKSRTVLPQCSHQLKTESSINTVTDEVSVVEISPSDPAAYVVVNQALTGVQPSKHTFAPHFVKRKLGCAIPSPVPVTLSIPVNIAHKVPGLLQEARLVNPDTEGAITQDTNSTEPIETDMLSDDNDQVQISKADHAGPKVEPSSSAETVSKVLTSEPKVVSDGTGHPAAVKLDTSVSSEADSCQKRSVCTLHTIQMAGTSNQVQNKIQATLLLLGHTYPSLKTVDMSTFCCTHKTQPTYAVLGNQRRVSMYSDWRAAPYDPNPKGLSSKQLLELYQSQRYECEPRFIVSGGDKVACDVTQSSYWTTREREFDTDDGEMAHEGKDLRQSIKVESLVELREARQHDPVPSENQHVRKVVVEAVPLQQQKHTIIITTTKEKLKEVINSEKSKKIRLFDGGYKSTEAYTYIRGRGRGKFVCDNCGIRCKKPSMLKKHIRTHTDVRPYHCRYCNFSFKTKGNLTKHMKSKTHHKLCMDMGIIPVPTSVDDDCILGDTGDEPESGIIYADIDGPTIGHIEEVKHSFISRFVEMLRGLF